MLHVWVVPGAKRTEVVGAHGGALKIRVAVPPEAGRANRELVRLLERTTNTEVTLHRGATNRRKTFLIEGLTPKDVATKFSATGG